MISLATGTAEPQSSGESDGTQTDTSAELGTESSERQLGIDRHAERSFGKIGGAQQLSGLVPANQTKHNQLCKSSKRFGTRLAKLTYLTCAGMITIHQEMITGRMLISEEIISDQVTHYLTRKIAARNY